MIRKTRFTYSVLSAAAGLSLLGGVVGAGAASSNLLSNPGFDGHITGWSNGPTTPWVNLAIQLPENTLRLTNNAPWDLKTYGLAGQCVAVEAGKEYALRADAYLPSGQEREGGAQLVMTFFAGAACGGGQLTNHETGTQAVPDTWGTISLTRVAPPGANSAWAYVSTTKNKPYLGQDWDAPLTVYFDNVFFGVAEEQGPGGRDDDRPDEPHRPQVLEEPTEPVRPPDEPQVEGELPGDQPQDGPGDEPMDEPQDEPAGEPQDQPAEPQDEPAGEPHDELQDQPLTLEQPDDGKAPLPPSTGTGEAFDGPNLALAAGAIAATMAAALGGAALMPARRKR